jgi:hypothetical protein
VHHERLEEILQELVVRYGSSGFNFDDDPVGPMPRIGVKGLLIPSIGAEQYRNTHSIDELLPTFDPRSRVRRVRV